MKNNKPHSTNTNETPSAFPLLDVNRPTHDDRRISMENSSQQLSRLNTLSWWRSPSQWCTSTSPFHSNTYRMLSGSV